jgi:putative transposase
MDDSKRRRRTIRLPDWDYRTSAYYFVTICTHERQHIFDDPRLHEIAANAWAHIPKQPHAKHVDIDAGVIMPNHGHGILHILVDPET